MLGDVGAAGGGGERHGGGDVEAVEAGAAGAAGIDQRQLRPRNGQIAVLAQHGRHRRQLLAAEALAAQGGEQGAGDDRIDLLRDPAAHQGFGLLTTEILAGDQPLELGCA